MTDPSRHVRHAPAQSPNRIETLCSLVVEVARECIGKGETTGNNRGEWLESIGAKPGHEWCAYFAGWCWREAWLRYPERYGEMVMMAMFWDRRTNVPEPGAKRLTKNLGKLGRLFTDPLQAGPGDLVCWSRGKLGWQGHVGIVVSQEDGIIESCEGNTGRYPSKVKVLRHDVTKERLFRFASLRT